MSEVEEQSEITNNNIISLISEITTETYRRLMNLHH